MFRVTFLFFLLYFTSLACFAVEPICTKLALNAESSSIAYYPPAEAKVIGSEEVSLYSAPHADCKIKALYVTKGSYLTVYKSYKDWVNVMYVVKDADFIGWLPERKVKIVGQYGRNP